MCKWTTICYHIHFNELESKYVNIAFTACCTTPKWPENQCRFLRCEYNDDKDTSQSDQNKTQLAEKKQTCPLNNKKPRTHQNLNLQIINKSLQKWKLTNIRVSHITSWQKGWWNGSYIIWWSKAVISFWLWNCLSLCPQHNDVTSWTKLITSPLLSVSALNFIEPPLKHSLSPLHRYFLCKVCALCLLGHPFPSLLDSQEQVREKGMW